MRASVDVAALGFDRAPIGLCVTRQRVIAGCNRAFAELFGHAVDELAGRLLRKLGVRSTAQLLAKLG